MDISLEKEEFIKLRLFIKLSQKEPITRALSASLPLHRFSWFIKKTIAETYKETKTMLEELISAFLRILFDRMASREMANFTDRLKQRVQEEVQMFAADNITKSKEAFNRESFGRSSVHVARPDVPPPTTSGQPAAGQQRLDGATSSRPTPSSQDILTLLAQLVQAMSRQQEEIALLRQELASLIAAFSVGQCRLADDRRIHECTALEVEQITVEHGEDWRRKLVTPGATISFPMMVYY